MENCYLQIIIYNFDTFLITHQLKIKYFNNLLKSIVKKDSNLLIYFLTK